MAGHCVHGLGPASGVEVVQGEIGGRHRMDPLQVRFDAEAGLVCVGDVGGDQTLIPELQNCKY